MRILLNEKAWTLANGVSVYFVKKGSYSLGVSAAIFSLSCQLPGDVVSPQVLGSHFGQYPEYIFGSVVVTNNLCCTMGMLE